MIEISHLRKEYPGITPLADVNCTIRDGEVISVVGPSGTGKTTLIRCINLLEIPTSGHIIVNGTDITAPGIRKNEVRQKIGMVFQSYNLFNHLTVIENIMQGPTDLLGTPRQEAYDKAMELLRLVGMDAKALDYPDMLSGGQKQRASIARTLAMDPDIILFDEPTSALDPAMVGEVESVIRDLVSLGKTMIIVTHEMRLARSISSRVFYMDQGIIYEEGTPEEIFDRPEKELTRRFMHRLKVFEIRITDKRHDYRGSFTGLIRYGYKNRLPHKTIQRIQSIYEEMCHQILIPYYPHPLINFDVEYSEEKRLAEILISYKGEPFDPRTTDNTISLAIVEKMAKDMVYEERDEEFNNLIRITVTDD